MMKITWEPSDVQAGRRVAKGPTVEQWIIGYDPSVGHSEREASKWAIISLEDGMISRKGLTRKQMADFLNETGDLPVELLPRMGDDR